jgi:diguanylate cyclase (GGDEF)-like protein
MLPIRSSTRLAISIGMICSSVVWLAIGLKLVPDVDAARVAARIKLAESVATSATALIEANRNRELQTVLRNIDQRNAEIASIGIRDPRGRLVFSTCGPAPGATAEQHPEKSDRLTITIYNNKKPSGQLELTFAPLQASGQGMWLSFPFPMILFCGALTILLNWSYLSRTLRHLNPSKVVPDRVRSAFDTLADGLLMIDNQQQIVMANRSFARIVDRDGGELTGRFVDEFPWRFPEGTAGGETATPWSRCLKQMQPQQGEQVQLDDDERSHVRYAVGATPILSTDGSCRGALVSFHDVTALEQKKEQLGKMLTELAASRDEVQKKNRDLQVLAATDALTGCLNRRSFFERFRGMWQKHPAIGAIMLDIDHFKLINDNYGHAAGDSILQAMGQVLRGCVGAGGLVGRYGGEEFAVALPEADLAAIAELAERIRLALIEARPEGQCVTVSLGVAAREQGAMDCQHLLDQADQSLYAAKREGRNRVVRWSQARADEAMRAEQLGQNPQSNPAPVSDQTPAIHYPVVTAIMSALAFRDRETAAHSTRVARLCVQVGRRMMSKQELYELEIAALLHDVGKIGVPDAILNKPGELTAEEWAVMSAHDRIGIEIVRSSFASATITEFISGLYAPVESVPTGADKDPALLLPLGARVLRVCDAYDAMTSERVYRPALTPDDALTRLYDENSGRFDPLVVRMLERVLGESPVATPSAEPSPAAQPSPAVPLEMGAFVENLSHAIATSDVDQLREIARRMQSTTSPRNMDAVVAAASRLELSIEQNDASLSQLIQLADEIIEMCRHSRSQVLDRPAAISHAPGASIATFESGQPTG